MTTTPHDQATAPALITIGEAAQLLNVSIRHMQRLTASGHFQPVKLGRSVRYRRPDIMKVIDGTAGQWRE